MIRPVEGKHGAQRPVGCGVVLPGDLEWEADVVPGPLQTERYARAVIRHAWPEDTDESNERRVALRMERQKRFQDGPARFWVVIDEAVLRRPVGNHEVMADQLEHLANMSASPQITLQLMPTGRTGHAALGVPFTLIDLHDGATYVYLDSLTGGLYVEDVADVERYQTAWSRLTAESLDFNQSRDAIREYAAEHRSSDERADEGDGLA